MLKSLYDYAIRNDLVLPPGYVYKTIKAYVLLYSDGSFQDVEVCENETVAAPDIGSLANGKDKCNLLVEKRSVVIPQAESKKSRFFLDALKDGQEIEPMFAICAKALEDSLISDVIRKRLDELKIKDSDKISFKVEYQSILDSIRTRKWWESFRSRIKTTDAVPKTLCLITGAFTEPMITTPPINGLRIVGGHGRGDALICFDKSSFCSYDLKKAYNAPVSEEAFCAVKAALDELLKKENSPVLAGMKFVHWYDQTVPDEDDPLFQCGDFMNVGNQPEEEDDFGIEMEEDSESELEETGFVLNQSEKHEEDFESRKETERNALKNASALVNSVHEGGRSYLYDKVRYHILLLTGVNGRVMVRRYERGNYSDLKRKLDQWHQDLQLIHPGGHGIVPPCKLNARLYRLLKRQKKDRKRQERLGKELAGITPAIITSILSGGVLPDAVALRALSSIRSYMFDDSSDDNEKWVMCYAYQWLKVWLIRTRGKGEFLMKEYNAGYEGAAYHCGAMMAVYEEIQKKAMPKVKASIVQRYYASAMQTPALVLGILSKMSVHHLEKIKYKKDAADLNDLLKQITTYIKGDIPATMTLEQQSEFALGYYQMGAELNRIKKEKNALQKEKHNTDENVEVCQY